MEKVKFLQSVKTMLDASGFSIEDLAELYGVKIVLPEMKSDAPERGSLVLTVREISGMALFMRAMSFPLNRWKGKKFWEFVLKTKLSRSKTLLRK